MSRLFIVVALLAASCAKEEPGIERKAFPIRAQDFSFKPAAISTQPGQKIKLRIQNTGTVTHNFTFASEDKDEDIEPGSTLEVDFTASETETHQEFFCKYHRDEYDMRGNVNVPSLDSPGGGRP